MASALVENTSRRPVPQACRFCAVKPGKGVLAKARGLTAQLIQFQYTDAFYFYFAKPINEIISQSRSPEFLGFAEAVIESSRPKLQFAHYTSKDAQIVLSKHASKPQSLTSQLRSQISGISSGDKGLADLNPFILNATGMLIVRKGKSRKNQGEKRVEEDAKEKRRAARCKEQMPLRAGDLLQGSRLFVDPDSFDTELFDIYSPKFSSDNEDSVAPGQVLQDYNQKVAIEPNKLQAQKRQWAWTLPQPKPSTESGKVEIPLLKLAAKPTSNSDAARAGLKPNTYQSDNQSTQFSSSYNPQLQAKVRRKQVLEDLASKISPGFSGPIAEAQTFRSATNNPSLAVYSVTNHATIGPGNFGHQAAKPAARLAFSPKLNRKRQPRDKRERKATEGEKESKEYGERQSKDLKTRNLTKNSLLNSNSWQMAQSWDHLGNKPAAIIANNFVQVEDPSNTAPHSARGILGKSQETFKASKAYGRNSSRKAGPSPENTTDRGHLAPPGSFRDKFGPLKAENQQICLTKRLRKPPLPSAEGRALWISVGQVQSKEFPLRTKTQLAASGSIERSLLGYVGPSSHSKGKSKERSEGMFVHPLQTYEAPQSGSKAHFLEIKPKKHKPPNRSMGKLAPTKINTATTIHFGSGLTNKGLETSRIAPSLMATSSSGNFASVIAQKGQTQRPLMAARRMAAGTINSQHSSGIMLGLAGQTAHDFNNLSLFPHKLQTEGNKVGYMWPSQSFNKKSNSRTKETHSFVNGYSSSTQLSHQVQFIPGLGILTAKKEARKTNNSRSRSMTKRGTATSSTGALASSSNQSVAPPFLGVVDARKRSQSKKQGSSNVLTGRTRTD